MSKETVQNKILLFSVDKNFITSITENMPIKGIEFVIARSHAETLSLFEKHTPQIVILDIENLPLQEMDIVHYIKMRSAKTETIILATIKEIENATYALHHGASFYLIKPLRFSDLKAVVEKVFIRISQTSQYFEFENKVLSDLMAGNAAMQKILKLCMKIAPTPATVLIGGESGTGKEFFAKIIHRLSRRIEGKFIALNCGAIPDTLFESELFGHKKGSFTGANSDKPGLVEEAHRGTLFLDEIGELSAQAQVKLLRFLQERTFRRIGDTTSRTVNVRVIAATNKNLVQLVEEGSFREDLFYRINVFYITLPPLRERKETIPNLVRLFVQRSNDFLNKNISTFSKAAEFILAEYNYPGNIRELENIIEHAMILAESTEITEKDLPEFMFGNRLMLSAPKEHAYLPLTDDTGSIITLEELEKNHIKRALTYYKNNYQEMAKKLGISRSTLWRKLKTYHIDKD